MQTTFGYQPLRDVLKRKGITQVKVAEDLNIPWRHLRNVIIGRTRPKAELRAYLPTYLNTPLEKLFTEEVLQKPYATGRGRHPVNPTKIIAERQAKGLCITCGIDHHAVPDDHS